MKPYALSTLTTLLVAIALPCNLHAADSDVFSVSVPDFLIPLENRTSVLDVFGDGSDPQITGYNVFGRQQVFLPANGRSAGNVTLNIHLPGFDAAGSGAVVESLRLNISVRDMDFANDEIYPNVFLLETAALTSINGVQLQRPVNFMDLVPAGAITDDRLVTLNPLTISASSIPWVDFSQPQVLSFKFTAQVASRGVRAYNINNAPEGVAERITYVYQLAPVPEPATIALLALGATALIAHRYRRRSF